MANQDIKCNVDTCKYNSSSACSLNDIIVGTTAGEAKNLHQTECASFEITC